ncbi:hypothetical protein MPH_07254 [Macrophomina phaseolina MS6]|uniref:Uncharacterized protein n=1 Tax=Macrophomina phaseolina (strain MS6) TaxID=1126212 RepID=K2RZ97_MACPH|nr:hypothetical protein MPH_07254 [Macrophomina phaseolina MS6]
MFCVEVLVLKGDLEPPAACQSRHGLLGPLVLLVRRYARYRDFSVRVALEQPPLHCDDLAAEQDASRRFSANLVHDRLAHLCQRVAGFAARNAPPEAPRERVRVDHAYPPHWKGQYVISLPGPSSIPIDAVVGAPAFPTRDPISLQDARRARSTISSVEALVMMMVLPSPESIAQGISDPGSCTAIVVCQYVGYARPMKSASGSVSNTSIILYMSESSYR